MLDKKSEIYTKFVEMEREVWADKKMQDFCINSVSELVQLDDGILPIDKENIETSFCFGAGMYGHSTEDEDKEAARLALRAERDKDYFIRRNMESWKRKLDALKRHIDEIEWHIHQLEKAEDGFTSCPGALCASCEYSSRCIFFKGLPARN